jgi:cell shape-determining protein MreC
MSQQDKPSYEFICKLIGEVFIQFHLQQENMGKALLEAQQKYNDLTALRQENAHLKSLLECRDDISREGSNS